MLSLFNPWIILGIVMAVLTSFSAGYFAGEQNEYERQELEIAALNAKARDTEQAMAKVVQTYGETLRKANHVAKIKEIKLRNDIATGERKLFIPVSAPNCPISTTADASTASGSDTGTTSAELDRTIADALVAITAEGDAAIRKLNTCVQAYETMRNAK
jgi:stress response protein YsnF